MKRAHILRWTTPLLGGLAFLALLGVAFGIDVMMPRGGLAGLIKDGLFNRFGKQFMLWLFLREILPLYAGTAFICWFLSFLLAILPLGPRWRWEWRGRDAFWISFSAMGWIHLWLWWLVPTTLWLFPGPGNLPLWLAFPLMAALLLIPALGVLRRYGSGWPRRILALGLWVGCWVLMAQSPLWLAKALVGRRPSAAPPAKVLMLALDGIREDVAWSQGLSGFQGAHYPNVYTPMPATRLVYSLLWGGDPEYFSVGHAVPSSEEWNGQKPLRLLEKAKQRGFKVRFYIDDGGTIGLAGRTAAFDDVAMPARGWENFVNSNVAARLPLYASWMDALRIFPTTNPWTDPAIGIRRALEAGRGADWVMYHSCLVHQPVFLTRRELAGVKGWWKLSARAYTPIGSLYAVTKQDLATWCPQRNPFLAYGIRTNTVLRAWQAIWNELRNDPQYGPSTRIFFSDHGERFYHATEALQLGGAHGFDLDPFELRVPLVIDAPHPMAPATHNAISLLDLRDEVGRVIDGHRFEPGNLGKEPFAPTRYHTLNTDFLRPSTKAFREYSAEGIVKHTLLFPDGLWLIEYEKPVSERDRDVSLAEAEGSRLICYKPLKEGGAQMSTFDGYRTLSIVDIDEAAFQKAKQRIEAQFFDSKKSTLLTDKRYQCKK